MNNKTTYLLKNTYLYGISTISTKLIAFLMVPFYTYILTKEDYGTIDIIITTISLLLPIATLSIHQAVLRFSLDKESDKKLIFSYATFIVTVSMVFIFIASRFFTNILFFQNYRELLLGLFITNIIYVLLSEFIRGMEKINVFVFGNIMFVAISTTLNLFTIAVLNLGIKGYLISSCIGYLSIILFYIVKIRAYMFLTSAIFKSENFPYLSEMLKYSVFLIPNSLLWWITNASDRYIILWNSGSELNAIYAVANKIPTIITSIFAIFIQAWLLSAVKEQNSSDKEKYYEVVFQNIASFIFIITSVLLVTIKIIIKLYVSESYFVAWESCSFLILSAGFNVLAAFIGNNYVVAKKNLGNMVSTLSGTLINIVLNLTLIPKLGLIGAGFATYISYFVVVIYRIIDTKKFNELPNKRCFEFNAKNILSWILLQIQIFILFRSNNLISFYSILILLVIVVLNRRFLEMIMMLIKKIFNNIRTKQI